MHDTDMRSALYRAIDLINAGQVREFNVPPGTFIGPGAIARLGDALVSRGLKRVFIVIDAFLQQRGFADSLFRSLAIHGIAHEQYLYPAGEPDSDRVEAACAQLVAASCDGVIAFGGGSVLDTAKAIALLATNPDLRVADLASAGNSTLTRLPLIAVPTTAGTGSEATNVTVITSSASHIKQVIVHPALIPDLAIIDACLTLAIPAPLTAATGIDALTHAIEAYVARGANPLTQALAHRAITLIAQALPIAVGQGSDVAAREAMMLGSYLAGMAFSNAGLGLTHAMAHQIGARYGIAHGVANAILLPSVLRFNQLVCQRQYAEIAHAFGCTARTGDALITAVAQLIVDLGLPVNLQAAGGNPADFADMAQAALADACLAGNPRDVSAEQVIAVYQHAWQRPLTDLPIRA
ncbi:iron-containing alcohol dehydrogenase family protein [Silvimonas iriomotensis]|uniref:Alcohol dehydrogenase EutG n=1 Tax=Silvimonas iriomotensis TaxID=449662 RepID=A0ABQ2PAU3_9NEIS|nr:iron-containing alcohol dehydrogenase [Silvimonas iriomotensis]GGP22516.1 alcohol dehydrogenase EutG [Silvimonas iriomotensis]